MNVDSSMCASSGNAAHWDQVDYPGTPLGHPLDAGRQFGDNRAQQFREAGNYFFAILP